MCKSTFITSLASYYQGRRGSAVGMPDQDRQFKKLSDLPHSGVFAAAARFEQALVMACAAPACVK